MLEGSQLAAGKPVNPLPERPQNHKFTSPLLVAIDRGFHSLVRVLLEGGALQEPNDHDSPMHRVLAMRRRDMVELMVDHGFDPKSVDLSAVLHTWDPALMEYFLERGADPAVGLPFAEAFCNRVRTAVKIFKKHCEEIPSLQEQANIALRYHCTKGNIRWIQLMLWAGADPYVRGISSCDEDPTRFEGTSALTSRRSTTSSKCSKSRRSARSQIIPVCGRVSFFSAMVKDLTFSLTYSVEASTQTTSNLAVARRSNRG